jgi:hypothetical protein
MGAEGAMISDANLEIGDPGEVVPSFKRLQAGMKKRPASFPAGL